MYAQKCIYIVIFMTRHERRSAKSTSCGRDRPQDPTFRGRTPTYQHTTYSNPRQSIQQCSDAQTCSAAVDSHHNSGHDRPSHHAQRSNINKHQTRLQRGEHPSDERSEHNAMGTHSSRQHAKEGGGYLVQNCPQARPAAAAAIITHHPTQKRLAEAETPNPGEAQNHSQVVVLTRIDLRSQHGRLVSARVSASFRKGVLGSCNRAACQAAPAGSRAYRIVLQRSRPQSKRKRGERGFETRKAFQGTFGQKLDLQLHAYGLLY